MHRRALSGRLKKASQLESEGIISSHERSLLKDLILDDEFSDELETAMTSGSPFFLRGLIKRDAKALQERKERLLKQAHEIENAIHLPEDESHFLEDMISKGDHDHSVQRAIEAYSRRGSVGTLYSLVHHRTDFEGKTAEEEEEEEGGPGYREEGKQLQRTGSSRKMNGHGSSRATNDQRSRRLHRHGSGRGLSRNVKLQRHAQSDGSGRGRRGKHAPMGSQGELLVKGRSSRTLNVSASARNLDIGASKRRMQLGVSQSSRHLGLGKSSRNLRDGRSTRSLNRNVSSARGRDHGHGRTLSGGRFHVRRLSLSGNAPPLMNTTLEEETETEPKEEPKRSRAQSIESKEEPSLQDFSELKIAVQKYHAQRGELSAEDYDDIRRKALHLQHSGMLTRDMVQKAHDLIDDGDGYVVFAIDKYHDYPEALQLYLYYKQTRKQAKESALARIDEKIRRKTLEIRESGAEHRQIVEAMRRASKAAREEMLAIAAMQRAKEEKEAEEAESLRQDMEEKDEDEDEDDQDSYLTIDPRLRAEMLGASIYEGDEVMVSEKRASDRFHCAIVKGVSKDGATFEIEYVGSGERERKVARNRILKEDKAFKEGDKVTVLDRGGFVYNEAVIHKVGRGGVFEVVYTETGKRESKIRSKRITRLCKLQRRVELDWEAQHRLMNERAEMSRKPLAKPMTDADIAAARASAKRKRVKSAKKEKGEGSGKGFHMHTVDLLGDFEVRKAPPSRGAPKGHKVSRGRYR